MKALTTILLVTITSIVTSCTSVVLPSNQYSVQAQTNGEIGSLKGESTAHFILFGLARWGDAGVEKAARKSGGKYIRTVDTAVNSFLGLYGSYSTKVTTENTPSK